ncbi:MAG: LysR family transcriptional regulator [Bryobacterales bacterium]|nr:LysR family transcriptional regulator [Bryobacterales bacterium]
MPVRVDTDHLRLFRDVVLNKSISKGAELNGISQSAASQHIQELERRLETSLLNRSTRPFTVTETGERYLKLCQDVLHRCESFEAELEQLKDEVRGVLRVAAIYSVGLSTMSEVEEAFHARLPTASLEVTYLRPERVYESVETEVCELGLISYPEATRELEVLPWIQETMVLGAAPDHPMAQKASVVPEDLHGVAFIGFDQDLPIRSHIDRFLRERKIRVQRVMTFDNIQMIKEALVLGRGVGILPRRMMDAEIHDGRLRAIPIETEELVRPLGIIHLRKRRLSRVAQHFCDMLQHEFNGDGRAAVPAVSLSRR